MQVPAFYDDTVCDGRFLSIRPSVCQSVRLSVQAAQHAAVAWRITHKRRRAGTDSLRPYGVELLVELIDSCCCRLPFNILLLFY